MTAIIIPRKHYTQPQGRVQLTDEWVSGYTRGWTHSGILTLSAAGEYVTTQHGVALRNAASGAGHVISQTYDSDWDWRGTLSYTVLSMFRIHSTPAGGDHPIVGSTTLTNHWNQYIRYNGTSGFSIRDSALNTSTDYEIATGDTVICVSSRSSAGATRISYITLDQSAVSQFRGGSSTADFYLRTANPVRLSGYAASATPLDILMFGMSRREWDHDVLLQNPWQIFRADPIRIYSLPTGPIIPSISAVTMGNILQTSATTNVQLVF